MHYERCVCPQCGTTLRVKDRAYLNRPVPCPDCRRMLIIVATGDDQLEARLAAEPAENEPGAALKPLAATKDASRFHRLRELATNVTVISWTATLVVAGMIGVALFRPKRVPRKSSEGVTVKQPVPRNEIKVEPTPSNPEPPVAVAKEPSTPATVIEPAATEDDVPIDALVAAESAEIQPADAGPLVGAAPPIDAAAAVVAAPPLPPVDFDARLSQPLKMFRQDRAISRRELLDLLEEMLGAPIRYDADELGDAAKRLDQKLSLDLSDVTVGEVLAKVLDQTQLTYDLERDALWLRLKADDATE